MESTVINRLSSVVKFSEAFLRDDVMDDTEDAASCRSDKADISILSLGEGLRMRTKKFMVLKNFLNGKLKAVTAYLRATETTQINYTDHECQAG